MDGMMICCWKEGSQRGLGQGVDTVIDGLEGVTDGGGWECTVILIRTASSAIV